MNGSPLERYLDELFLGLRRDAPRDGRSLLSETESHLRDAAEEAEEAGLPRVDAELLAIDRFGDARRITATDRDRTVSRIIGRAALSAWSLGCIGAVAVGFSGIIAGVMRLAGASTTFIAGNGSTANLNPTDCARWLSGDPRAHTCAQAALSDWTWEIIGYRIAIGVLGALVLAVLSMARRQSLRFRTWSPLPDTVVDTIGTTIFGIAGVWLAGLGIDAWIVSGGRGAGFWLSAAPVALGGAFLFGHRLLHDLEPTT